MIVDLLLITLAVLWGWETFRAVLPWSLPAPLQPLIVITLAAALCWPDWRLAMSAAGATGILHAALSDRFANEKSSVSLRRGVGGRMPPLP